MYTPDPDMQGLMELEVSYRWFRTCKDAEGWCMRKKGAGATHLKKDNSETIF